MNEAHAHYLLGFVVGVYVGLIAPLIYRGIARKP